MINCLVFVFKTIKSLEQLIEMTQHLQKFFVVIGKRLLYDRQFGLEYLLVKVQKCR